MLFNVPIFIHDGLEQLCQPSLEAYLFLTQDGFLSAL